MAGEGVSLGVGTYTFLSNCISGKKNKKLFNQ